uniref:Testis cDNA clone: QtsA-11104, similar to human sno, strawberry notch homolog 1 (Drosophila) (SBNO1),mRNA, RefSeq: NM_018183.2 n=1 Tax=Macaca fascicularis TaxID=9541 RepID=Q4R8Z1_MACFA|nr:unnamed protein product [Macaca fascicularis]
MFGTKHPFLRKPLIMAGYQHCSLRQLHMQPSNMKLSYLMEIVLAS